MTPAKLRRRLRVALDRVDTEISNNANSGSFFGRGLAAEGYAGGYRDALSAVLLLLNDVEPNDNRGYWRLSMKGN